MKKRAVLIILLGACLGCVMAFAQGPCPAGSGKLACVIPLEYGFGEKGEPFSAAGDGVFANHEHEGHFNNSIGALLGPVTKEIGRQANLLPLASPSSGVILTYDPSLKTFVASTDSLGPILGERAETVGRHRLFIGFSYQFFNFDKIDSVNLHDFPVFLVHAPDSVDNTPVGGTTVECSAALNSMRNVKGCSFVRDLISTVNSIDLKVNQYTTYVTFGLTRNVDLSLVIPVENVRMSLHSNDHIILGSDGTPTSVEDSGTPGLHFDHLWGNCANYPVPGVSSAEALDHTCLNHSFPDPTGLAQGGSRATNSASGIGDLVARVKWNAFHGEHAGVAVGLDTRFPTGDALNYLGSGSYGVKPFAIFSYRAKPISPHALVGYEWNSRSITSGDLTSTAKGAVPRDFVYSAGVDALVTKWLTGSFDVIGQRIFGAETISVASQEFLAPCGPCTAAPTQNTVTHDSLQPPKSASFNITNASMGVKVRPWPKLSHLVATANLLVRLDDGGLHSKPVPLIGVGYTF
jgi:hypothetical protein